jgi:hypothetical protein
MQPRLMDTILGRRATPLAGEQWSRLIGGQSD